MTGDESRKERGDRYELQVFDQARMDTPDRDLHPNVRRPVPASARRRQVDVYSAGQDEIYECKCYKDPVDVKVIDALIGMRDDLGAASARIFSASGFTSGALERAEKDGVTCEVMQYESRESQRILARWFPPNAPDGFYNKGDSLDGHYGTAPVRVVFGMTDDELPLFVSTRLDWGDPTSNRSAAVAILGHQLQDSPDDELVDRFVADRCGSWEQGQHWQIEASDVRQWLWSEGLTAYEN